MKKIGKRALALLLAGATVLSLCGCGKKGGIRFTTGLKSGELFRLEDEVCTRQEALVFVLSQKNRYERAYGKEIWNVQIEGERFSDYMRDRLQDFLARMKCMTLMAKQYEVALTEEESIQVSRAAEAYMEGLSAEAEELTGIKKEHIESVFHDYYLSNKLIEQLTAEVSTEISEDEARVILVQQVFISTDGLSPAEKEEKRQLMEGIRNQAGAGADFAALAREYNEAGEAELELFRGEAEPQFEEAAFALSTGQVSQVVETAYGFHVIKCLNNYEEQKTAEHKKELAKKIKEDKFYESYDSFVKTVVAEYNGKAWSAIDYSEELGACDSDFYEVYKQYFGE